MTKSILTISLVVLIMLASGCSMPARSVTPTISASGSLSDSGISIAPTEMHSSPVMFLENVGQFDPQASFQVRGESGTLWLAKEGIWITLVEATNQTRSPILLEVMERAEEENNAETPTETPSPQAGVQLKLSFADANPDPQIEPFDRLSTNFSYFLGSDPENWRTGVPAWGGVRYRDIYPGIDLEITSEEGKLVQRIVAQSDANLDVVKWKVEGAEAKALEGDRLRLTTSFGDYELPLLQATGAESAMRSLPTLSGDQVSSPFSSSTTSELRSSTASSSGLIYSTFLGGYTNPCGLAIDSSGAAYMTGYTYSSTYPITPGAFDATLAGELDVFVAKLSPDGSSLIYSTFLGGSNVETGYGIAIDYRGAAYVTGSTYSSDFPTTLGAFDRSFEGVEGKLYPDVFVTKLDSNGSALLYSTFIGGWDVEEPSTIVVDGNGSAYITGYTWGGDFPTTPGAFDTSYNGSKYGDAFVIKLNPAGNALIFSTYLGGGGSDGGADIALDSNSNVYVTGSTHSGSFPTTPGAFDTSFNACNDAFVAKLNPSGSSLIYSTYLGGTGSCYIYGGDDGGSGIAVDSTGSVYVSGSTNASNFPTTLGSYDPGHNGGVDIFIAKLNSSGSDLIYSTFLGSTGWDGAGDIAIDSSGAAYISGQTLSSNFPTTPGALDPTKNPDDDAFIAKLDPTGSTLIYSSYLGGDEREDGRSIVLDSNRAAYISGPTSSDDFPTTEGAYDNVIDGLETFVVKMYMASANTDAYVQTPAKVLGQAGGIVEIPVDYGNGGMTTAASPSLIVTLPSDLTYLSDTSGITPVTNGDSYTWSLPDIPFPSFDSFTLQFNLPPTASSGVSYPVLLEIASTGTEDNTVDNNATTVVLVGHTIFLTVVRK